MSLAPPRATTPGRLRPGFALRAGVAVCLALILAYAILAAATVARFGGSESYVRRADFVSVLTGADILRTGQATRLYEEPAQQATQAALLREVHLDLVQLLPYNHPPFEALLILPLRLAGMSGTAAFTFWTAASLLAVAAALAALHGAWPVPGMPGILLAAAALAFFPLARGFLLGQNTAFVLLGLAAGSAALRRGAEGWAGVALALTVLKPQMVPVLVFVLLITGRWRALAAMAGTLVAAVVLTLPILGLDWPLRYGTLLWQIATWPANGAIDPATMQNWRGFFTRVLGPGTLTTALAAGATAISVIALWVVWRRVLSRARAGRREAEPLASSTPAWDLAWAATLLIAMLANPHLQPHDLALALVPGWILTAAALRRPSPAAVAWLWLGWAAGWGAAAAATLAFSPAVLWLAGTAGVLLILAGRDRDTPVAPARLTSP